MAPSVVLFDLDGTLGVGRRWLTVKFPRTLGFMFWEPVANGGHLRTLRVGTVSKA